MNRRSGWIIAGVLFSGTVFVAGWLTGATIGNSVAEAPAASAKFSSGHGTAPEADHISFSSSAREVHSSGSETDLPNRVPLNPAESEKFLRQIPYAQLKSVFLERQDAEWLKARERFPALDTSDSDYPRNLANRFQKFQSNLERASHYIAAGEWTFHNGKVIPYKAHIRFYGAAGFNADDDGLTGMKDGTELCYLIQIYLRLDSQEKDSTQSSSTCLPWLPFRNDVPYAILSNYKSKRLVPIFSHLAIPLPGTGGDADATAEWNGSESSQWRNLSRVRWQSVTKVEYEQNRTAADLDAVYE